jgi:hypothetical protein
MPSSVAVWRAIPFQLGQVWPAMSAQTTIA